MRIFILHTTSSKNILKIQISTFSIRHSTFFATLDFFLATLDFFLRPSTFYPRPSTFYSRPSTFYSRPSTFDPRHSTFYPRHSTLDKNLDSLRSQAIKASANLTRTLGLMFKLNKHVDLIAAKFAADFLD